MVGDTREGKVIFALYKLLPCDIILKFSFLNVSSSFRILTAVGIAGGAQGGQQQNKGWTGVDPASYNSGGGNGGQGQQPPQRTLYQAGGAAGGKPVAGMSQQQHLQQQQMMQQQQQQQQAQARKACLLIRRLRSFFKSPLFNLKLTQLTIFHLSYII